MTKPNQFPQSSEKVENQPDKLKEARELIENWPREIILASQVEEPGARELWKEKALNCFKEILVAQDLISRHEERARCAKIVLDCRCSCNCEKFDDYVLVEEVADKILNPSNHE